MTITAQRYTEITGANVPDNFNQLLMAASDIVNARTLYCYEGRTISALPSIILNKLESVMAYEIQALDANGGVEGANAMTGESFTMGKVSISGAGNPSNVYQSSALANAIYPSLIAMGRGLT